MVSYMQLYRFVMVENNKDKIAVTVMASYNTIGITTVRNSQAKPVGIHTASKDWLNIWHFVPLYPDQCQGYAEIGLLSFWRRISQGASLGDFLLAPKCPIEKVTLWVGLLYLTP